MSQNARELFKLIREKAEFDLGYALAQLDETTDFSELAYVLQDAVETIGNGFMSLALAAKFADKRYGDDMMRRKASEFMVALETLEEEHKPKFKGLEDRLDVLTKRMVEQ